MPPNPNPPSDESLDHLLLEQIWNDRCLLDALCDPRQLEANAALTLAPQMMERYRNFDTRLVAELMAVPDVVLGKDCRIERCLEILDAVSSGRRIIMPLLPLMNSENQRVRSKVARILGRRVDNLTWTRKFLDEVDDRTRANIIESLWGSDSREIREVLWQAVPDGNNRVRGNAILALYRLGVAEVLPSIRELAESPTATHRATAAWVMGATGDSRFREFLKTLRQDADGRVRAAVLRALVQLNKGEGTESPAILEPRICFCEDLEGVRRVGFDLPEGGAPRGLLPTDAMLTDNGELVWDYTFVERRSCPLSALFLIFDGLQQEVSAGLGDAFVQCLDHKDSEDRWSVARMAAGPEGDFKELRSVKPLYKGPELKSAIAGFGELPRIKTQELPLLVRRLGTQGPGRHLVLLHAPPALSGADLEKLETVALALHLIVDAISFGSAGNEPLQKVARLTDGVFINAPEGAISPDWMVQTYRSMAHRYEVTYPLTASAGSEFEIRISPPRSKSTLSAGPNPNRPNTPAA